MDLAALTTIWATLRQKLVEETGLDDDELMDTLDGELDLADRLRSLIRKRRQICADAGRPQADDQGDDGAQIAP